MRIHGLAPALNYGQQALEGLKAYRMPGNPGGIALFRPDRNAARMQHSAEVLAMPLVPVEMFVQACRAAVALNAAFVPPHESGGALYVRPQLYGSGARFIPAAPDEYTFCVFVLPTTEFEETAPIKALILDDFDRAAPKGTGHAKVGGNYGPVLRWSAQAMTEGFGATLHLDSARHEEVDEFSKCAFLGARSHDGADGDDNDIHNNKVTIVVPDSPCVIDSVTSASVQELARHFGWTVEKRAVPYIELPAFTEVLGAGTGLALLPIRSITRRRPDGQSLSPGPRVRVDVDAAATMSASATETITYLPDQQRRGGPVYHKLLARLRAIQRGTAPDEFGWRFAVRAEDGAVNGGQ